MLEAQVDDLDDFTRDLRAAGTAGRKAMDRGDDKVAKLIADEAQSRAKKRGGSAAKGARSIVATHGAIDLGGASAPWMLGAEFGSKQYAQFPRWKGNSWNPDGGTVGYFLHPAVRGTKAEVLDTYDEELLDAASAAFPD